MHTLTRREFLGLASLGLLPSFACSESEVLDAPELPNILVFVTDDQPAWTAGFRPDGVTPWMPKLHAALSPGVTFDRAYVTTPLCSPSRISMLTGKWPHSTGIVVNPYSAKRYRSQGLAWRSVAHLLASKAGYRCFNVGKFINPYSEVGSWVPTGYARWATVFEHPEPVRGNFDGMIKKPRPGNSYVWPKQETSWMADRTLGILETAQGGDKPWFGMVGFTAPHTPVAPSDAHRLAFNSEQMPEKPNFDHLDPNKPSFIRDLPPLSTSEKDWIRTTWRGMMEELLDVDDAIERICASIDFENTYVFFLSDNGFLLGEHRLIKKSRPYEEAVRTPLMVRGPGVREAASTDLLASCVDLAPTACELAGLDLAELESEGITMDGRSLVGPLFTTDESTLEWRNSILTEQLGDAVLSETAWSAIRTETQFYVEHDNGERELYDMVNDPYQLTNVAPEAQNSDLMPLIQRLDGIREASGSALKASEL